MMLFGEKYPDVVRMVAIGEFSKELCGGTHLDNTGQVGLFKIIGEESVAAGTRRITALTGRAALESVRHTQARLEPRGRALRRPAGRSARPRRGAGEGSPATEEAVGGRAEGRRGQRRPPAGRRYRSRPA